MTFHAKGFRTLGAMGIPAADSVAGSVRQLHSFVTNDDVATVETANYFDALIATVTKVKTGDVLIVSIDVDGTPKLGFYVINVTGGHVVITTAAGSQVTLTSAALTGTLTGTANGALVDVAATAASTPGASSPSAGNVDTGIATAVASIVTGVNEQNKEFLTMINKLVVDVAALKAAL